MATLGVAAASCTDDSTPSPTRPSPPAGPSGTAQPISPLTWFSTAGLSTTDLVNDIQVATKRCMQRAGYEYAPETAVADESTEIPTWASALDLARTVGYALPPNAGLVDKAAVTRNEATASKNPGWLSVLNGEQLWQVESQDGLALPPDQATGCLAEATRDVLTPLPAFNPEARQAIQDGFTETDSSPEMVAALTAWQACMRQDGYTYATSDAARESNSQLPDVEQREVAQDDVECAQKTTYPVQYRLEYAAASQLVETHPEWKPLLTSVTPQLILGTEKAAVSAQ